MAGLGLRLVTPVSSTSNQPPTFENVSLFATCALPGCHHDVAEWGDVCTDCVQAAGDYLRPASGPRLTEDDIGDRDRQLRDVLRAQHSITATATATGTATATQPERNHTCWLCEQRRTCTNTEHGWECDDCRQVQ